jgi:ribosomal protein L29
MTTKEHIQELRDILKDIRDIRQQIADIKTNITPTYSWETKEKFTTETGK